MEPAWRQHDETWEELLRRQSGAVSRQQALEHEWTPGRIDAKARLGRWQRPHPGVFVTFTGPLPWSTKVWAGLLHAGPDAVASHRTAARLASLLDVDPTPIELLVPWGHRVTPRQGLVVRSSRFLDTRAHPVRTPPQTRVEHTVLDLVDLATSAQDAVGWLTRACQRRVTTPHRLLDVAAGRRRLRYRRLVVDVLSDVSTGVASPLELRYVRDVERRHGLPTSVRGQRVVAAGRHWYADVRYAPFRVRVELEGLRWHPTDQRWLDDVRDNAGVLSGDVVLRFSWRSVAGDACGTAAQVAAVLAERGWPGSALPCSRACPLRDRAA